MRIKIIISTENAAMWMVGCSAPTFTMCTDYLDTVEYVSDDVGKADYLKKLSANFYDFTFMPVCSGPYAEMLCKSTCWFFERFATNLLKLDTNLPIRLADRCEVGNGITVSISIAELV